MRAGNPFRIDFLAPMERFVADYSDIPGKERWGIASGEFPSRSFERQTELFHARELADIRTQSHALRWHGTAEELTATITRWYEAGWIEADSLADALRRAGFHFITPLGIPVISQSPRIPQAELGDSPVSNPRKAFVDPVVVKKGWSIHDWAIQADVSYATARDYLANKTKSYASTRLKLANALEFHRTSSLANASAINCPQLSQTFRGSLC